MPIHMKKVPKLPFTSCAGCVFNGCYPWNRNPLMLCCLAAKEVGGYGIQAPLTTVTEAEAGSPEYTCQTREDVTEDIWDRYMRDRKREADAVEGYRVQATQGVEVMASNPIGDYPYRYIVAIDYGDGTYGVSSLTDLDVSDALVEEMSKHKHRWDRMIYVAEILKQVDVPGTGD